MEICRSRQHVAIPGDLERAYFDALSQLPGLVAAASTRPWDAGFLACALAAVAAAKQQPAMAAAALELTPELAEEFLGWLGER